MSLAFFSDQCVPLSVSDTLRSAGHSVTLLEEALPIRAKDPEVILKAQELDAILLTINGDFSDVVGYPPARFGGIVAIQFQNHPEILPMIMAHFLKFLVQNPDRDFYRGKLLIVEVHRIRVRS